MDRRAARVLVWIALAVPLVMDAVYFSLIRGQNVRSPDLFTVPFVAAFMLLMTALLGLSLSTRVGPVLRATMRGGAAGGLIVLGFLGAFSIGAPILLAGLVAAIAFGLSIDRRAWAGSLLAGTLTAIVFGFGFVVGIDAANRVIVCPPESTEGGGGAGIVLGPYQYQCSGGQVTWSTPTPVNRP